jgi:hypothetical protein
MRRCFKWTLLLILAACSVGCSRDANVPDDKDFLRILQRDITEYVTDASDKEVSVTVELLRDRPTQSGVALPKFYVWIVKRDQNGAMMEEAVARIAAVEKTHFDVVQYYPRERILNDPELMQKVFPDDVYKKILERVNGK